MSINYIINMSVCYQKNFVYAKTLFLNYMYRIILLLFIFCVSLELSAQDKEGAFQDGEWLRYKVNYGWFNATTATLEVEKKRLDEKELYHIKGKGKTTGLIDVFFKVRDKYESYVYTNSIKPYKFIRQINEGGYRKDKAIYFNHKNLSAEVHNYKKERLSQHEIKNGTQDLISATYYLRNQIDINNLKQDDEFRLNLFFDEENFDFKTIYLGEETIDTEFGLITCLKFRPYVKTGRIFDEKESVTFWITKDDNKLPIKIEAKLTVGSLVARLDAFKGLAHSIKIAQRE